MASVRDILRSISKGRIVSIIQRELEANGDRFGLLMLKHVLESGGTALIFLYEPLNNFLRNLSSVGIDVERYLGDKLWIFDVFATMNRIERNRKGIYTLSGYMDDMIFVHKLKDFLEGYMKNFKPEELWVFTYLSSGTCKLFNDPEVTYKVIWFVALEILGENFPRVVILYYPGECKILEDAIYYVSDVVIETLTINGKKVGIVSKGEKEGEIFELFREE
ncbi:hypothetical protein PNA2_0939 [Pyrococcus sp. NA2]|uniref:hypothetical protein n=1 Tax=Pyrococcus sp. (strain NA2) TaxID=342949 RepID=UPI000209A912|nr:hypothetical protein [Pyrococcus sp. NA2]AEC51855.1 hypothetical protein PNA2_0939 [Pyrococcus sp. NA2]